MKLNEKVLYFDEAMPWLEAFFEMGGESHPALFVIMPSGGHWKLRGIPPSLEARMQVRVPQPREWAGLLDVDLKLPREFPAPYFAIREGSSLFGRPKRMFIKL